jgi:hypothetical protein
VLDPIQQVVRPREFPRQHRQTQRNHEESRSGEREEDDTGDEQHEPAGDLRVALHQRGYPLWTRCQVSVFNDAMEFNHE